MPKAPKEITIITDEKKLAALRAALGDEEFAEFEKYQDGNKQALTRQQVRSFADSLVSEGGKYAKEYEAAQAKVNAIWDKAVREGELKYGVAKEA